MRLLAATCKEVQISKLLHNKDEEALTLNSIHTSIERSIMNGETATKYESLQFDGLR